MPGLKHTHTYARHKTRKNTFMCTDPHCTHYTDRSNLLGKASRCNGCGTEIILTGRDLQFARPKCPQCSNSLKSKRLRKAQEIALKATEVYNTLTRADFESKVQELSYGIGMPLPSDLEEEEFLIIEDPEETEKDGQ